MPNIDHMKIVGALSKTLNMETIDMKFHDKSTDRLDIIMGGAAVQEKKFHLSLSNFLVELTFPRHYLSGKDFEKWLKKFEYELEQAFVSNVDIDAQEDSLNHVLRITV